MKGNILNGTIPSSLGQLAYLQTFDVADNYLIGTLPEEMGNCTVLNSFITSYNLLTGTIPWSYMNLTQLNGLVLTGNFFRGHIPSFIGNMKKLVHLELDYNLFSGSIPVNLTTLPIINTLYIDNNHLTGTIPLFTRNGSQLLNSMDIGTNLLHGTIQSNIFEVLPSLIMFSVQYNQLTGKFPNLDYLNPDSNGIVDDDYSNSVIATAKLTELYMNNNQFDGILPDNIGLLRSIHNFDLHENQFIGTIPETLWSDCIHLTYLYLYGNLFTGTLHSELSNLNDLVELRLDLNKLTGKFPLLTINSWQNVNSVNISYNSFTGSIPIGFSQLTNVEIIDLSNNQFIGEINDIFGNLINLQQLYLQSNSLQGNLDRLINVTLQTRLNTIDISDNQIHGKLPLYVFGLPNITIFSASKNCLTGSLGESICDATSLTILALDGLHTATSCQNRIFPGSKLITAYMLTKPLTGQIPSCLFNRMPNLQTLHLSGNGIGGDLDNIVGGTSESGHYGLMESLSDLSLSYNRLTGKIPNMLLTLPESNRPWTNLDLSFNKFTGVLDTNMWNFTGSSLKLDINRLSGPIPKALRYTSDINILDGNMFSCTQSRTSLPEHDPETDSYVCGSDAADRSLYAWLGFSFATLVILLTMMFIASTSGNKCIDGHGVVDPEQQAQIIAELSSSSALPPPRSGRKKDQTIMSIDSSKTQLKQKIDFFIGSAKAFWEMTLPSKPKPQLSTTTEGERDTTTTSTHEVIDTHLAKEIRDSSDQLRIFGHTMTHIRTWSLRVCIFILLTVIPIVVVISLYYSRYTYSYAWFLSTAFLTGITPAVILLIFFMIFLAIMYCRVLCTCLSLNFVYLERQFYSIENMENDEKENKQRIENTEEDEEEVEQEDGEEDHWLGRMTGMSMSSTHSKRKAPLAKTVTKPVQSDNRESALVRQRTLTDGSSVSNALNDPKSDTTNNLEHKEESKKLAQRHTERRRKLYLVLFAIFLFNVSIVLVVNMVYVYFLTTNLGTEQKQLLSFLLAFYKFVWNTAVMEFLQDFAIGFLFVTSSDTSKLGQLLSSPSTTHDKLVNSLKAQEEADEETIQRIMITFFMLLSLFNNIMAPIISVAIVSSDCFYYVVKNPPQVTSSYSVTTCNDKHFSLLALGEVCTVQSTTVYSTSYDPPFVYSYQCTSELLVNFVDIFIYRYLLGGIVAPAIEVLLKICQEYLYQQYGEYDWRVVLCTSFLQPMLRPVSSYKPIGPPMHDQRLSSVSRASSVSRVSSVSAASSSVNSMSTGGSLARSSHSTGSRDFVALRVTSIFQQLDFSRSSSSQSGLNSGRSSVASASNRFSAQSASGPGARGTNGGSTVEHPLNHANLMKQPVAPKPGLFASIHAARKERKDQELKHGHDVESGINVNTIASRPTHERESEATSTINPSFSGTIARPPSTQFEDVALADGHLSFSSELRPSAIDNPTGQMETVVQLGSLPTAEETKRFPLFKAKNYIIILVSDMAIMLVFGTVFPPIAVVGCVTVLLRTIFIQIILGRFIYLTQQQTYLLPYLQQINKECLGIRSLLLQTFQTLSDLLGVIWGCFLFDILGDQLGLRASFWILALMSTWAFAMRIIDWFVDYIKGNYCTSFESEDDAEDKVDGEENKRGMKAWWFKVLSNCCGRKNVIQKKNKKNVEMSRIHKGVNSVGTTSPQQVIAGNSSSDGDSIVHNPMSVRTQGMISHR